MNYQKVTNVWFGSKIKSALTGIIIGPLLILIAIYFLAANEFRSVARTAAIIEWESIVETLDTNNIEATNQKFVYTNWNLTSSSLNDSDFWLNIDGVAFERKVEMYLWDEESKTEVKENLWWSETHTTTYSYKKRWSSNPIDSQNFEESQKYINPTEWKYESRREYSQEIQLNDFYISENLKRLLPLSKSLSLQKENFSETENITLTNNFIFIWNDFNNPEIWDIRISYTYLPQNTLVSMLAYQENENTLWEFVLNQKQPLSKIVEWNVTKNELFQMLKDENTLLTWILRWVLLLLMYIGFYMLLSILPTLGSIVPFLGKIIGFWVGIIAFVWTIAVWGTTIAIAWFAARPIISILILLSIAWIIYWVKQFKNNKKLSS